MIRMIAHRMKLAILHTKTQVCSFSLRLPPVPFFLSPLLLSFPSLPEDSITSTSSVSFQLCVGPPRVMEYQRQPEGMYFSYLSDFYFGGPGGVQ